MARRPRAARASRKGPKATRTIRPARASTTAKRTRARTHAPLPRPPRTIDTTRAAAAAEAPPPLLVEAVLDAIARISPFPPEAMTSCLDLRESLGLTTDLKRALSDSFQRTARRHNKRARITDDECAALGTVEDAVALVAEKAGFAWSRECR